MVQKAWLQPNLYQVSCKASPLLLLTLLPAPPTPSKRYLPFPLAIPQGQAHSPFTSVRPRAPKLRVHSRDVCWMNESELEPAYINEKMSKKLISISSSCFWGKERGLFFLPKAWIFFTPLYLNQHKWFWSLPPFGSLFFSLIPLPSSILLVFMHIICLASALGTSKTMRTFSCHRYPLMCPFWVGSLNCLLNKTLTSSPQPCPYSILASQLYWQQCLSTHFYGGLKEIDYYCAQIKWGSNATPVWLSCNWSELYTGAICNIFSKLNFFLFGFYWCMFRCPLGLPFFQWKLQHVNFHTNYSNSRYLYLIHYNRSNQG